MTTKTVLGIAALILGLALIGFFITRDPNPETEETATPNPTATTAAPTPSTSPQPDSATETQASAGTYVEYQENSIASTPGTKILFFHAPWCPQCRALEASITSGSIPEGTTIMKVDYDSNQALRQKYGVTLQTTLVSVDDSGQLVKKFVAYDEPTLGAVVENLL